MKCIVPIMLLLLTACSHVPVEIKDPPSPDLQLAQYNKQADKQHGINVRWGGQVVKIENDKNGSTLHIAQFPLNGFGRPNINKDSDGRFLAHSSEFIDPYIYKVGTRVTVYGAIKAERKVNIDKKTLNLPLIEISDIYRWIITEQRAEPYWQGYPYYYDRFGYGVSYPHWRSHWHYGRGFYW